MKMPVKMPLTEHNLWWDFEGNYVIVECDYPGYPKILKRYKFVGIAKEQIKRAEKYIKDVLAGRIRVKKMKDKLFSDDTVFIIDRIEHGNGGVMNINVLAELSLPEALKKTPYEYGVSEKMFDFWPVITSDKAGKDILYYWDEYECQWHSQS